MFSGFTFLNASLLFGALAFAIPLIIHLLHRTKFSTVPWGAMIFIDDLRRVQTRRLDWQSLLLLLIRCAIPICLALCMARPLLSSKIASSVFGNGYPKLTTLLFDNSLSLEARPSTGSLSSQTLLDQSRSLAAEIVTSSPGSSRWSIQTLADATNTEVARSFTRDQRVALREIENVQGGAGSGFLIDAMERAIVAMQAEQETNARLVVLSDFQRSLSSGIDPAQIKAFRERLDALPNRPSLVFVPLSPNETKSFGNVAVRVDSQTRSIVGVGQPWEIRVLARNFQSTPIDDAQVILVVDGIPMVSKPLALPSLAESQAVFHISFPDIGSHRIEARLDVKDDLLSDNTATWSVLVLGTISVLIIDPTLDIEAEQADSDFLQAALAPYESGGQSSQALFHIRRVTPEQLTSEAIANSKFIILADVASIADEHLPGLRAAVQAGASLLVFAGERTDPTWYNENLFRDLPLKFSQESKSDPLPQGSQRIRRESFQHPALRFLNDIRVGGLESLEVRRWFPIVMTSENENFHALLQLDQGDPLWVEGTFGKGHVLVCSTTCDDRWTNWPLRPLYLPMFQQWLTSATPASTWQSNVATGQTLELPSTALIEWLHEPSSLNAKDPALDVLPSPSSMSITYGVVTEKLDATTDTSRVHASHPGFYTIHGVTEASLFASAQTPISESDLERLSTTELELLADQCGAAIADSYQAYSALGNPALREYWRWLLGMLLVFLFGELLLQRSFVGVPR